ncbi:MAG: TaqI-like C-terminal specificity domain-containing protein [Petrimonas sp.]|nr:TaqI-like C-terminal specificity domain-containing protein [Petrimonas sp.]
MAFFQQTVLDKYLRALNREQVQAAYGMYKTTFHNAAVQENIRSSKEAQYQEGFLRDLFVRVLGYTLNPTGNYNLTTEYKNVKDSKKADGAIIVNGNVKAVIELKGTETTDLDKIETQAFGYKNNQPGCTYVIISNFEKLRFYIDNAVEHIEFNLFTLTEEEFASLWVCLAYENIRTDLPLKIKTASISEEDKVTKELYKDYSRFKQELFRNMVDNNVQFDELELFKKSQKLLDRFLFIFFAEDRNLLPPNSMRKILNQWEQLKELDAYTPLYSRFKKYFEYMNTGFKGQKDDVFAYNGGLFKPDALLDAIVIDDDVLHQHTLKLSEYNYVSEVDVNILGHIFENSLNEIDEVKARIEGRAVDKNKTKRKKDGVYYTPKYITKYIVENTVGKLCDEKKQDLGIVEEDYLGERKRNITTKKPLLDKLEAYREWLLHLTICDPACGSGAFLNQALDFLIGEHHYIDELKAKLTGFGLVFEDVEVSILENNLFGVDLNEESVEIAKLSLWLRTARPRRKLNDLNNNIKCGNSLIEDPDVAGDKAFNWQQEFPHIFARGGFDVVIGNPPYVNAKGMNFDETEKHFYYNNYKTAIYQIDTYLLFVEKFKFLLKKNGSGSYIIPNSWLNNIFLKDVRKFVLENFFIDEIVNAPNGVFIDATVDTIILSIQNKEILNPRIRISSINNTEIEIKHFSEQSQFYQTPNLNIDIFSDKRTLNLISKIEKDKSKLNDFCKIGRGVGVYHKRVGHTKELIAADPYQSNRKRDETFVPYLRGKNIGFYYFQWTNDSFISYGDWLAEPREEDFFVGERIVLRQIPDRGKLLVTFLDQDFIIDQSVFIARFLEKNISPKYVVSILGSKLMYFYFKNKYSEFDDLFPKVKLQHFKDFPILLIANIEQQPFVTKADQMLSLNKELQELSGKFIRLMSRRFGVESFSGKLQNWHQLTFGEFVKELKKAKISLSLSQESEWETYFAEEQQKAQAIQQQITQTDREIDQMVYQLYGLTEEEIAIVEELL